MKVLLAIDGSPFSQAAVDEVSARPWPADTEVRIVTAVEARRDYEQDVRPNLYERARTVIDKAVAQVTGAQSSLRIIAEIVEGDPKDVIVEEAENWGADLIVVGSHGRRGWRRLMLGSVSQAVALKATCSVLIVRDNRREQQIHTAA